MKKIIASILCIVVLCTSVFAFAEGENAFFNDKIIFSVGNEKALVNGDLVSLEEGGGIAPKIVDETVMIPIRFLSEKLGATVFYEEQSRSVFVMKDEAGIIVQVGNPKLFNNTGDYELPVAAFIENSRTFVCANELAKELGASVLIDGDLIIIASNGGEIKISDEEKAAAVSALL